MSSPSWMDAGVSRGQHNWNKRVLTWLMTVEVLKHFVYIELLFLVWCSGDIGRTHSTHSETPDTKGWLVKHTEFMSFRTLHSKALSVILTATSVKAVGLSPHDRVLCNVVQCNDTTTSSRPTERRKMSLSGERKEKDRRRRKKSPLKVLMCCLAVDLLFAAKSLHRLKCTYSIKHPAKQPASYLAAVCLQGERIQLAPNEDWENKKHQVYSC